MSALVARAVMSVTAAVIGGFLWFFSGIGPVADADMTLGAVLDRTRSAETLHLKVVRDGQEADVWVEVGGRLRWEESPTRYQIADGTSLWEIDESTNTARPSRDASLRSMVTGRDLLALLGVEKDGSNVLRNARPVGFVSQDGRECLLYRVRANSGGAELTFEAYVDRETDQLRRIAAWPADRRRKSGPPVAELRLIARNIEIDESQFVVGKSLSEDGRIGKVAQPQGIVTLRPALHRRWTPVVGPMRLRSGDQLRTDVRGANAVGVMLTSGAKLTVGPGSLVELVSPAHIKLHYGEVQLEDGPAAGLKLEGPLKTQPKPIEQDVVLYRVNRERQLFVVPKKPLWLLGFEGSTHEESIGSLIVNVDGRNTSLSVGYHRVKVEIRDQIARTTIEESFVNRTRQRLEGVFHFPLPQDASISGFGMWIGDELVEADVVEKQRAREIYETILRERRDPGLLEWAGGNIFKARVFPIEPRSEKRIKIVYTQVLPLRANQYRYSYALRSELLRKTPLRELSIDVLVNSSLPLKSIDSPTHPVRVELGQHSASLQFTEQEYSPDRDFELVCDVGGRASDVVTIPHRRGDDGYFMIQLMPPSAQGDWRREVLPDGDPLNVLLVCDTSGSMDRANRKAQAEFVAAVLSSLGPADRFNLAVCDADSAWLFKSSVVANDENVERARSWLDDRISMGWTDLDRMFESVQQRTNPQTHVVYIGDGVVSARNADPQDFAARIRRLYGQNSRGTFHAVSTGSSFESVVLKAIASLGRGSVRQIGSGQTAQSVALELLNEVAQPGLRDLKVEFRGVDVAAVYPQQLPNLAAGTQQILIGRYLPTGEDQEGEIVVTGMRGNEPVRYTARIPLKDAEQGNSFVPRLWARAHLDHLLQQGSSQFIQDEIIALSEEFHIMTPYTSLLVLETDEDRERFGVKRRFEMRDGERFFADGADAAQYELLQKTMREAGNWRLGLRTLMLRQLAQLGRHDLNLGNVKRAIEKKARSVIVDAEQMVGDSRGKGWFDVDGEFSDLNGGYASSLEISGAFSGGGGGFGPGLGLNKSLGDLDELESALEHGPDASSPRGEIAGEQIMSKRALVDFQEDLGRLQANLAAPDAISAGWGGEGTPFYLRTDPFESEGRGRRRLPAAPMAFEPFRSSGRRASAQAASGLSSLGGALLDGRQQSNYVEWLRRLFPHLPAPAVNREASAIKSLWPADAIEVSKSLLRNDWFQQLEGGLLVRRTGDSFSVEWNRKSSHRTSLEMHSPQAWLTWSVSGGSEKQIHWADETERGVMSMAYSLGRVRKSAASDLQVTPSIGFQAFGPGLHLRYSEYDCEMKPQDGVRILSLVRRDYPRQKMEIRIDDGKQAVTRVESWSDGKLTHVTDYRDFVSIEGVWWPTTIESRDGQQRLLDVGKLTIERLDRTAFADRMAEELQVRDDIAILREPVPNFADSEVAAANGTARFEHRLALIVRASLIQKWSDALQQLEHLEQVLEDKSARHWIRIEVLKGARRNAEVRELILGAAQRLLPEQPHDQARAEYLIGAAQPIFDHNEMLELLNVLKPVFDRQPEFSGARFTWQQHQTNMLRNLARMDELLELERQSAQAQPWNVNLQTQYARDLAQAGNVADAYEWLESVLDREENREDYERNQVYGTWSDLLRQHGQSAQLVAVTSRWVAEDLSYEEPYSRALAALVFDEQVEEAQLTARKWIQAARIPGQLDPANRSRLTSAVSFALSQGWGLYGSIIDSQWLPDLYETAAYFMDHDHHFDITRRIMSNYRFSATLEADRLRGLMLKSILENAATLSPPVLASYCSWVGQGRETVTEDDWRQVIEKIRARWDQLEHAETGSDDKHTLGGILEPLYATHIGEPEQLEFIRERVAAANDRWRDTYAAQLFNTLMARTWTAEREAELFALIPKLSTHDVSNQLLFQVEAVQRLVDRLVGLRVDLAEQRLQDEGHPEKLTRIELAERRSKMLVEAREAVAKQLGLQSAQHGGLLRQWFRMEQMYLQVLLNQDLPQVAASCREILGEAPSRVQPVQIEQDQQPDEVAVNRLMVEQVVESVLKNRALVTYANLAVRKSASASMRKWLMSYIDAGIELSDDNGDSAQTVSADQKAESANWRRVKFGLLIAFDDPESLEREIRSWIQTDEYVNTWRLSLARLSAERGAVAEAIKLFEVVRRDSVLSAKDYNLLSNLYLVQDRAEDYLQARVDALKAVPEYQLSNYVNQRRYRWERRNEPLPTELDKQVLYAYRALFEKSDSPANYLYSLAQFYRASRDFRLLQVLPDAVTGRTPQQVYGFLSQMRGNVLNEVRKEATADEIIKRIRQLRERDLTTLDQRSLDLLEAMVESQSAEVVNQPGPHIQSAVAALKRAFEREWSDGEGRQMAMLLHSLGKLKHKELADEQVRQLQELYRRESPGTDDRLFTGWYLASAIGNSYGRREEGLDRMEIVIREFEQAHADGWPVEANSPLNGYISMLQVLNRHQEAEQLLNKHLLSPLNPGQHDWLKRTWIENFSAALAADALVSLGTKQELYQNLVPLILSECEQANDTQRYQLLNQLAVVFRTAKRKQFTGLREDLHRFAFVDLPELLKQQRNDYESLIDQVSNLLHELADPRMAVEFLVERLENYPARLMLTSQRPWNRYGYRLARWRQEAEPLGDLEPRLLALVLAELRFDLQNRYVHSRYMYRVNSHFWKEKEDDFARVAEEVLSANADSARHVIHIAEYLWGGLHHRSRAIEVMFVGLRKGLLYDGERAKLVDWLHETDRYAESIAILEGLLDRWPLSMHYRCELITAYNHTSRKNQRDELLAKTDELFRAGGRWTEPNLVSLLRCMHDNGMHEMTVKYGHELIPLVQRTRPNQGIGPGSLSMYYGWLADAHASLQQTSEAVDAASAAVVSWGPRHEQRQSAVQKLYQVMLRAKDRDAFVKQFDEQAAETGQDSPLIRQSLGKAYAEQGQHQKAIEQLRIAVELQPGDMNSHELLLASYDAIGDQQGAIRQLLELIDVDRHNLEHYQALEKRLREDEAQAERAATSIVEAAPLEAENHQALAMLRDEQKRFGEAIVHWKQVAELRSLEPDGLISLAKAQIQARRAEAAEQTLRKLRTTDWPSRFESDVRNALIQLDRQLQQLAP